MIKKHIYPINTRYIEDELINSYLSYATSVIIDRALPDIRDGLKPVHRRILYAMYILKNFVNKPYKKSARIVGDVIGKYHPHGDNAVYDAIVRMAQKFSLRYPLIKGQGNFGSIDGDPAAAMRYTEIKMSAITQEFFKDLDKNTINYTDNYDATEKIPEILPTTIPNILINGITGIAVGMATNIPPHNIKETMLALIAYLKNKQIKTKKLLKYIKGPDFPTGGIIYNNPDIYKIYKTGKGTIKITAKIHIEKNKKTKKHNIIITQLPYQVNKTKIIEKILILQKNNKIEGIQTITDESDKTGMRINIYIKKNINIKLLINKLLSLTNLNISYNINMLALYKGKPVILTLKKIFKIFIKYRIQIIKKKILFQLNQIYKQKHILEGLLITLENIKQILLIIRSSKNKQQIKNTLLNTSWTCNNKIICNTCYRFSKKQIKHILRLSIIQINKNEYINIQSKYNLLSDKYQNLTNIINNNKKIKIILKNEFKNIIRTFGDNRITSIINNYHLIKTKDLINNDKILITISKQGYIKYQKLSEYQIQHKRGKGKSLLLNRNKEDTITHILITKTHHYILFITNQGKLFSKKAYHLPYNKIYKKGKLITDILKFNKNEKIINWTTLKSIKTNYNLIIVTNNGLIKKIDIYQNYNRIKKGLNIITLKNNNKLISINKSNGQNDIMLFTKLGKTVRFSETLIRKSGKYTQGIIGIKLKHNDEVTTSLVVKNNEDIFILTKDGYGKRTSLTEFPTTSRATKGIKAIKLHNQQDIIVGAVQINQNDQIIILTNTSNILRILVSEIKILKRNTVGIILIRKNHINEYVRNIQKINILLTSVI